MKHQAMCLLAPVLSCLLISGCVTPILRLNDLSEVSPQEAVIVGKFHIKYNGKDVKGGNVLFDAGKTQCLFDESGYVFGKFPSGRHSITTVIHPSGLMTHQFGPEELTCQLSGGGVINYIGDITFNWNGISSAAYVGTMAIPVAGVVGNVIKNSIITEGQLTVSVDSNEREMQAEFGRRFATDRKLKSALLLVKPPQ
jgi:hypothetical protein